LAQLEAELIALPRLGILGVLRRCACAPCFLELRSQSGVLSHGRAVAIECRSQRRVLELEFDDCGARCRQVLTESRIRAARPRG
jgi:hypothetical protein